MYALAHMLLLHCSIHRPVCQACYRLIEVYLYGQSWYVAMHFKMN